MEKKKTKEQKQLEKIKKMLEEFEEVFDYDIKPSSKNYLLQAIYIDFKKLIDEC